MQNQGAEHTAPNLLCFVLPFCNLHYEKFADGTVKCIEDEIPFDLPKGWEWARINTFCILNPKNMIPDDTTASFVPMSLIKEGYANEYSFEEREWSSIKSGFTHFANNDIAIAKITPCFENRKSVVFKNLLHGVGAGTTELFVIRCISDTVLSEYLLWNFKTKRFIDGGVQTYAGDVGQQRVRRDYISKYLIAIPPQAEQKCIVDAINLLFELISSIDSSYKEMSDSVLKAKSKILDLAIRGKLVPQDPNDEPASVLLERIRAEKEELIRQGKIKRDKKDSVIFKGEDNSYYLRIEDQKENIEFWELGDLPGSWGVCTLGEICDYGNCINVDTKQIGDNEWILDLEDIEKDSGKVLYKAKKQERNSISTKHKFYAGQVLYSKLRPYLNKVVLADENGYCTSEILPLVFSDFVLPAYAR